MPLVEITLTQGRTTEQIRNMITAVHEAIMEAIAAPSESIRVIIREIPPEHFAAGNQTIAERRSLAK